MVPDSPEAPGDRARAASDWVAVVRARARARPARPQAVVLQTPARPAPGRDRRSVSEVQDGPAAAAEAQAAHHCRHNARLDRRLQLRVRVDVCDRLCRASARARDGTRDRAAPRGHQGQSADVHPLPRRGYQRSFPWRYRACRGAGRARWPDLGQRRRRGVHPRLARDRQRHLARTGIHRVLPKPLQPAAGDTARWRAGDGGHGPLDVGAGLRGPDPTGGDLP